jgi:WD40 repeat protein
LTCCFDFTEKKGLEKNEINCMDFDYTYTRFATAGKDLSVRIYDVQTSQVKIY